MALAASALLHGVALAVTMRVVAPPPTPVAVPFPVALVELPGSGDGAAPGAPPTEVARVPEPPPPLPEPVVVRKPVPRPVAARRSPPAETAAVSPGAASAGEPGDPGGAGGGAGNGGGGGSGAGSEGNGSGGARVAYGTNPLPIYPLVARRLGKEGVVLLDVLVAPDGRAADVRIVDSSGFGPLDESAVTTVRQRWRFIPASRDGTAVESRVTVPIRFRLSDVPG